MTPPGDADVHSDKSGALWGDPRPLEHSLEHSLEHYTYDLPKSAIAQQPLAQRDQARLLVDQGPAQVPCHLKVADLAELLNPGDVVVLNDARVLQARLKLRKPTGGQVEVLVLAPETVAGTHPRVAESAPDTWEALVRPSRRVKAGTQLLAPDGQPALEVKDNLGQGKWLVSAQGGQSMNQLLDALGEVPLPPYIGTTLTDSERYQTVYANQPTATAAPTAGLHLTPQILAELAQSKVTVCRLNLAVGLGTFKPITATDITQHDIHQERYQIPQETWQACQDARVGGGNVVAIGTTVVRALESASHLAAQGHRDFLSASTQLYITPGYEFQMTDALLTNFHQPQSTLLVMLAAFMGPRWRQLYETALSEGYRFLSFGDAMFCRPRAAYGEAA